MKNKSAFTIYMKCNEKLLELTLKYAPHWERNQWDVWEDCRTSEAETDQQVAHLTGDLIKKTDDEHSHDFNTQS